jgi:osmotically-inducible protein OsmY
MRYSAVFAIVTLALCSACSKTDQEQAQARANEAQAKTKAAMHKLDTEAKVEAHKLNSELGKGMNGSTALSTNGADAKLDHAGQVARTEAAQAGRKLDHATVIARVKAKLAADVGLATVANVRVDAAGSIVTLSGTVSTADQKRLAEQAASQVDGVTHVVDQIQVQP